MAWTLHRQPQRSFRSLGSVQMKRRDILKSGLVLAGTTALAAPAIAQTAPTIRWRLTSSFPKSLETIYGGGEFFADRVNKLTDGKFNIRVFAAGDIVPAFSGARRRAAGHRRDLPHRDLLLRRQGLHDGLRHGAAVRAHHAPAERLDVPRRRHRHAERVLQGLRRHRLPGRQHRRADGRLVPQSGEHARRLQGPEDAHPRPRRPGDGAHRRGAAGAARRRHLSGAGARRDRRHRMGRPLRRREARLLQDRQELLLPGLVGAVLDVPRHDQPGEMGRAAEAVPGGDHQRGARGQPRHGGANTTPRTGWR